MDKMTERKCGEEQFDRFHVYKEEPPLTVNHQIPFVKETAM